MKGTRVLSQGEIDLLKKELKPRDRVLMMTGLFFGLRISEMIPLTFGDVSGDTLRVKSSKGSVNISFPIPADYKAEVEALRTEYTAGGIELNDHSFLFLSGKGGHITREYASQTIRKVCSRLGISGRVNTHSFRKTFVTRIYNDSGKDIVATKKCSRHKNIANLDYYIETTRGTELITGLKY